MPDFGELSRAAARPLIRESAIMAAAAKDPRLKKRVLTKLYIPPAEGHHPYRALKLPAFLRALRAFAVNQFFHDSEEECVRRHEFICDL